MKKKLEGKEKEWTELKEKVVSLQAQLSEQSAANEKLKTSLAQAEAKLVVVKSSAASSSVSPVNKDPTKVDDPYAQPVLINDPAGKEPTSTNQRYNQRDAKLVCF